LIFLAINRPASSIQNQRYGKNSAFHAPPRWPSPVMTSTTVHLGGTWYSSGMPRLKLKASNRRTAPKQDRIFLLLAAVLLVFRTYADDLADLRAQAAAGDAESQITLGLRYGNGVKQVYQEAVFWFRQAAEQGFASAHYTVGFMYDEGTNVLPRPSDVR
jgi:TPR repeat protein